MVLSYKHHFGKPAIFWNTRLHNLRSVIWCCKRKIKVIDNRRVYKEYINGRKEKYE